MKNRLLEDFGDSQSAPPVRAPGQTPAPAQAQAAGPPARQRPGVWRNRSPAPPPPPRPRATRTPEPFTPSAAAAPPDISSFSSAQPDWSVPLQPQPPSWSERWGRKALGWTLGVAAVVAVGATAAWMVRETEVQSTLAVVAGQTPARASVDAPPVVTATPLPEAEAEAEVEAEALPPLKLLPREQLATAAPDGGPAATERVGNAPDTGEAAQAETGNAGTLAAQPPAATPPPAKPAEKPAVKPSPERRVAAAEGDKRRRPEAGKPAPKQARDTAAARTPTPPARAAPAPTPDPQSPLAETLRLCRAAGYHATACLKRGCEATRFGLVCRG